MGKYRSEGHNYIHLYIITERTQYNNHLHKFLHKNAI